MAHFYISNMAKRFIGLQKKHGDTMLFSVPHTSGHLFTPLYEVESRRNCTQCVD